MNLIKCIRSFKYAFNGVRVVLKENNLKVHLLTTFVVIILSYLLKLSIGEWLWVLAAISSVLVAETINTAIEKLTNLVSPQYDPLAGEVKDLAAAAVLIAAVFAATVGGFVFLPKIFSLL